MDIKRFAAEAAALLVIAVLCATVANSVAARNRKLAWQATYPNALVVPAAPASPGVLSDEVEAAQPEAAVLRPVPDELPSATLPPSESGVKLPNEASPEPTPAPTRSPVVSSLPAAPAATPKAFPPDPDRPWLEISPEDVMELYSRKMLFIDARRTDAFEQGHIAGARSMPVWEADVDARVAALYDEGRDQNAPVVIYCSGGACEDSHMLGQKLWGVGFDNVLVYKEGFPDWQKRGGAVARGPVQ